MEERADFIKDQHLEYLDDLRESGVTNMFGAAPYVQQAFMVSTKEARAILSYWMKTFSERHEVKTVSVADIIDQP